MQTFVDFEVSISGIILIYIFKSVSLNKYVLVPPRKKGCVTVASYPYPCFFDCT